MDAIYVYRMPRSHTRKCFRGEKYSQHCIATTPGAIIRPRVFKVIFPSPPLSLSYCAAKGGRGGFLVENLPRCTQCINAVCLSPRKKKQEKPKTTACNINNNIIIIIYVYIYIYTDDTCVQCCVRVCGPYCCCYYYYGE